MQQTLKKPAILQGYGLHTGSLVNIRILPSDVNHGIVFKRVDVSDIDNYVQALFYNVVDTSRCTKIANNQGVSVSTIEHLMAALWSCGIDNAVIEIDGPEVPIMDGSSSPFIKKINACGIITQNARKRILKVTKQIDLYVNDQCASLIPYDGFVVDFHIDFKHKVIGQQNCVFEDYSFARNKIADYNNCKVANGVNYASDKSSVMEYKSSKSSGNVINNFENDIAGARTFGFISDIEHLQKQGLAKGASLENTIGLDDEKVLNKGKLRYDDEFVRHKILDCVGDLYLSGMNILGYVKASKSGHTINNKILHKLFSSSYVHSFA